MIVIKRNGTEVPFDRKKIVQAIEKALLEVDGDLIDDEIADFIGVTIEKETQKNYNGKISVEQIQDLVEDNLIKVRADVAKAYIRYRYKKEMARAQYSELMDVVSEKLTASNVQNQNANVDEHSFGGRIGEMSGAVSKQYALENIVSKLSRENHLNNEIYIHDLDSYAVGSHNCLTIPFDDLLAEGFNTRQADIRPANSVGTAFQLVAVIFQLQSLQQFGGVSASHLDWTMVPYVRKSFWKHLKDGLKYTDNIDKFEVVDINGEKIDMGKIDWAGKEFDIERNRFSCSDKAYEYALEMTEKELRQAVEAMYHNLNTLQSRSGNQLPFTSINYGTCTLPEGRMVTKALLDGSIKGVGKLHKTSIFPCGIFQCMKGINREPGDPNYDLFRLALKSTAQRLYPNYVNVDWSVNAGYDRNDPTTYVSTMGKRKLQLI